MNPFGHGWHLNRSAFEELLRETAINGAQSDDHPLCGLVKGRMTQIDRNVDGTWILSASVPLDSTSLATFHGRWIVDATGRKASVATKVSVQLSWAVSAYNRRCTKSRILQLGARIVKFDPLLAFYAVFEACTLSSASSNAQDTDTDHRTLIEAIPEGWFYSSLVPSYSPADCITTRVVVFHTHPSHPAAKVARRRDGSSFLDLVHGSTTHISSILRDHAYELPPGGQAPVCTAAGSSYLDKPCDMKERWNAVGDAAMAFDPLSSQGMMTALEMGYCVGTLLGAHLLQTDTDGSYMYAGGDTGLEQIYSRVRGEYNVHRAYYYSLGKKRFPNEQFWNIV